MAFGLIIQRRSQVPLGGLAGMLRNRWPESIGISGRNDPEYASHAEFRLIAFGFTYRKTGRIIVVPAGKMI
jgi:hypothetical protein